MTEFGPPKEILSSVYEINPDALEQVFQVLEQRGLRIPVGQVVGYQREGFVVWLSLAVAQSIPDNTQTRIAFDSVLADKQKAFSTDTITLPYAGVYLAWAQGGFAPSAAGAARSFVITQNGVGRSTVDIFDSAAFNERRSLTAGIVASKGDLLRFEEFQDSGGALNTLTGNGCSFGVALLTAYNS